MRLFRSSPWLGQGEPATPTQTHQMPQSPVCSSREPAPVSGLDWPRTVLMGVALGVVAGLVAVALRVVLGIDSAGVVVGAAIGGVVAMTRLQSARRRTGEAAAAAAEPPSRPE